MGSDRRRTVVLVGSCLVFASCTTVQIENGRTVDVVLQRGSGGLSIEATGDAPLIVRTRGFGLVTGVRTHTLGYLSETAILVPDSVKCRVFFLLDRHTDLTALQALIERRPEEFSKICIVSLTEGKDGEKKH